MLENKMYVKVIPAILLAFIVILAMLIPGRAGGDLETEASSEQDAVNYHGRIDSSGSLVGEATDSSEDNQSDIDTADDTEGTETDTVSDETESSNESTADEGASIDEPSQIQEETETETETPETSKDTEPASESETADKLEGITAVAQVEKWVNVRVEPTTQSGIVGKIYNNCAATIIDEVEGEGGSWYLITSGNVNGYIKSEYFVIGEEAEKLKSQIGITFAKVMVENLRVRSTPDLSTDDNIITMYPMGTEVAVISHDDEWALIETDAVSTGYVHVSCIQMWVEFDVAISLEEEAQQEAERLQAEEAARRAQEEYEALLRQQEEANKATQPSIPETQPSIPETQPSIPETQPSIPETQPSIPETQPSIPETQAPPTVSDSDVSAALRNAIVAFALQFEGCPYVHGGRSLSQGTDCSGFTNLLYQNFGYTLDWTPAGQANLGTRIDYHDVRPGDLLFYSNSYKYLGHVALYIGNGKIIHAASEKYGICIWDMNYREPLFGVRIIN